MQGLIRTITGDIRPQELGFTQSHEHILLRKGTSFEVSPVLWQDEPDKSLAELEDYRRAGGDAIVDAQPVGCGRMALEMESISQASGVKIIASTGFHKLVFYGRDHWINTMPEEELAHLFVSELTEGMFEDGDSEAPVQRTGFKAGQIKTALDKCGLTDRYRALFGAAALAAGETGAPVMIHIENGTDPLPVLDFLREKGLDAGQLIFCHLDRAVSDLKVHEQIARSGAFLEYDTIGRFKYHSDEAELEILRHMTREGFAGRILFSLDTTRARLKHYGGEISLTYLIDTFIPKMLEAGFDEAAVQQFARHNPAEAFSWRNLKKL